MADKFTGAAYNDDDIIKKYGSIENHQRILKDYRDHLSGKKPEKPKKRQNNRSRSMSNITKAVVIGVCLLVSMGLAVWAAEMVTESPNKPPLGSYPTEYELTRQTAENTRYIFILLCAGWMCLFGFYLPLIAHKYIFTD